MTLADYLASLTARRWAPGMLDCGVFMADWAIACGRPDPIADVRGSYGSERGFLRILRREGGFAASCAARLAHIGAIEVSVPSAGDFAVVLAPYAVRRGKLQQRPTGAICVSPTQRAVITSDMGVVIAGEAELSLVKVWRLAELMDSPVKPGANGQHNG
ncbi:MULTISPECIES: DUF6950 family protein [unclassified Bradyrhizobium]|uniref:DUF6950 family protein n=1 Tax=unclassified Bradyrhizobium TaxID=2631580 RepID=UPI0028E6120B|nr:MULTISPECIES: hypothetical protein [unclassified Bradyrhizobium]